MARAAVGLGRDARHHRATVFGLVGTSPLATRVASAEAGTTRVEVEHPPFLRYENVERLHVRVHAPDATGGELAYAFRLQDGSERVTVTFSYWPRKALQFPGEAS